MGMCIESLQKISLKPNVASHNNASWYTDTDGFSEYSPSQGNPVLQGAHPLEDHSGLFGAPHRTPCSQYWTRYFRYQTGDVVSALHIFTQSNVGTTELRHRYKCSANTGERGKTQRVQWKLKIGIKPKVEWKQILLTKMVTFLVQKKEV